MSVRILGRALWLGVACTACDGSADSSSGSNGETDATAVVELGEPVTLLGDGDLGLRYFPDEATVLLGRGELTTLIVVAGNTTYRIVAPSLERLREGTATAVLGPGNPGEFDNGYAGIAGVHRMPDGMLYGFYHAEDQEGLDALTGGVPGFYARIGAAVSNDDGVTWQKLGPVIASSQPKEWAAYPGQNDRGVATPGLVVDPSGRYLYLYYDEHSRLDGRAVVTAVARADLGLGPPIPGSFRKYHAGAFEEPGLGGRDTPIVDLTADGADVLQPHVVHSAELGLYVMVLGVSDIDEYVYDAPLQQSGIHIAYSRDGLAWSRPEPLVVDYAVPKTGRSMSWEATILWDAGSTRAGQLVYGYTPSWPTPGHYMVARRIALGDAP